MSSTRGPMLAKWRVTFQQGNFGGNSSSLRKSRVPRFWWGYASYGCMVVAIAKGNIDLIDCLTPESLPSRHLKGLAKSP